MVGGEVGGRVSGAAQLGDAGAPVPHGGAPPGHGAGAALLLAVLLERWSLGALGLVVAAPTDVWPQSGPAVIRLSKRPGQRPGQLVEVGRLELPYGLHLGSRA